MQFVAGGGGGANESPMDESDAEDDSPPLSCPRSGAFFEGDTGLVVGLTMSNDEL